MKAKLVVVALLLYAPTPLNSSQTQQAAPVRSKVNCEDVSRAIESGAYVYAAIKHLWPPSFGTGQGLSVAVEVRPAIKVILHTADGKYELWMNNVGASNGVWQLLEDEAAACRLPPDPANAVKLFKISWEHKELSHAQFEELHGHFMTALTGYIRSVSERSAYFMRTDIMGGGVDASYYAIVYDNSWQHLEIEDWDLPIDHQTDPMIAWVHEFVKFADSAFGRPIASPGHP
ncbi:MAG TPA: hypothetical protein VLY23_10530 [Candidatus Acidoferrum sp.]|nr:hypothetical protein [Candidatus Acidoferrum sp.]